MVFNVVFGNTDDHLKNHAFIYDRKTDGWKLSPAYDITFALNPLINFKTTQRALSINGKRQNITLEDWLKIADEFTIKNPKGIIKDIESKGPQLMELFVEHDVPQKVVDGITKRITKLV